MQEPYSFICALDGCEKGCYTEEETPKVLPYSCFACSVPDYCTKKHRSEDKKNHASACINIVNKLVNRVAKGDDIREVIVGELNGNRQLALSMFQAFERERMIQNCAGALVFWTNTYDEMSVLVDRGKRVDVKWFTYQTLHVLGSNPRFSELKEMAMQTKAERQEAAGYVEKRAPKRRAYSRYQHH